MGWRRGQAYGQDLRERVLACGDMTLVQVATRFGVSPSYVSKVRARLRDLGDARPGPQHGHVPLRLAGHTDALQAHIKASPDATLNELRAWLSQKHQVSVSYPVMWNAFKRLAAGASASDKASLLRETALRVYRLKLDATNVAGSAGA